MSSTTTGIMLLGIFFILLILRTPISFSLSLATIITLVISGFAPEMFADIMESAVTSTTLLAIPFFIIAGNIMDKSGISKRIVNFAELLIGDIPGGLGIISVIITVFWGAISGSGPATVVALGPVLIPLMVNAGYNVAFAAAIVAAGSGIAIIIPPSITFIVYGVVVDGVSVGRLFAAGILPGILMGFCFSVYVFLYSIKHGYRGRKRGTLKEISKAFIGCFWGILSPVIILGGIYGGIFTPTEAAAVAAVYSLLIGIFAYKELKIKELPKIMADSGSNTAMILLITAGAAVMSWLITTRGIATVVTELLLGISSNPMVIILMIFVVLLIAGFFLDGISIVYLFCPLLIPAVTALGYDKTWFGVIMIMAISIGMITPPVACNLYPAAQLANVPLHSISKQVVGLVISGIIATLIVIFMPQIALIIPNAMNL